jgi:hypothetical protein
MGYLSVKVRHEADRNDTECERLKGKKKEGKAIPVTCRGGP